MKLKETHFVGDFNDFLRSILDKVIYFYEGIIDLDRDFLFGSFYVRYILVNDFH